MWEGLHAMLEVLVAEWVYLVNFQACPFNSLPHNTCPYRVAWQRIERIESKMFSFFSFLCSTIEGTALYILLKPSIRAIVVSSYLPYVLSLVLVRNVQSRETLNFLVTEAHAWMMSTCMYYKYNILKEFFFNYFLLFWLIFVLFLS